MQPSSSCLRMSDSRAFLGGFCRLRRVHRPGRGILEPPRPRIGEKHLAAQGLEAVVPEVAFTPLVGIVEKDSFRLHSLRLQLVRHVAEVEVSEGERNLSRRYRQ